jgi:hypothetical protein
MVEEIMSWGDLSEINCSILLPLPGSHVMSLLREQVPAGDGCEDLFDPETLRREWIERFCKVSYERLVEIQGEMRKLHCRVGTFGLTIAENADQTPIQDAELLGVK